LQNLYIADAPEGLSMADIVKQGAICFAKGCPIINNSELQKSLDRLEIKEHVFRVNSDKYRLTDNVFKELDNLQNTVDERIEKVAAKLFSRSTSNCKEYISPFIECICAIFSSLGEAYVQVIKGEIESEELISKTDLQSAIKTH